jgi:hypothetical protein
MGEVNPMEIVEMAIRASQNESHGQGRSLAVAAGASHVDKASVVWSKEVAFEREKAEIDRS